MIQYALGLLQHARLRAQALRESPMSERGASALEWAIISAIVAVAAVLIATAIAGVVRSKSSEIEGL